MSLYRLTLRHGGAFELDSTNGIHSIADRLAITPANAASAPYWVVDTNDRVAVRVDDIVAIERIDQDGA